MYGSVGSRRVAFVAPAIEGKDHRGRDVEAQCQHGNQQVPSAACLCGVHFIPTLDHCLKWAAAAVPPLSLGSTTPPSPLAAPAATAANTDKDATAHLGSDRYDPVDILRYWADKDLGADVLNVEAGVMLVDR